MRGSVFYGQIRFCDCVRGLARKGNFFSAARLGALGIFREIFVYGVDQRARFGNDLYRLAYLYYRIFGGNSRLVAFLRALRFFVGSLLDLFRIIMVVTAFFVFSGIRFYKSFLLNKNDEKRYEQASKDRIRLFYGFVRSCYALNKRDRFFSFDFLKVCRYKKRIFGELNRDIFYF